MRALLTASDVSICGTCSSQLQRWGDEGPGREAAEQEVRQTEEKYLAIFEDAVVGIFQTTPEGRPLTINRTLAQIHGYSCAEQLFAEVPNVVEDLFVDPRRMDALRQALDEKGVVRGAEIEVYCRDRSKRWILANMRAVRDADGKIVLHEGTVEDITDRKLTEERVQFLAYHDALTGLPNRTLLEDRLAQALASARRRKEKVALLFLDLDRFKMINDSCGHSFGNLLLQEVADRLRSAAREQDTVARVGGDEFIIVLTSINDAAGAAVAAERILKAMTGPFVVEGHSLDIRCSMGISIFPEQGTDGETLIKNADASMYNAKEDGGNHFCFFTKDMEAQVTERLSMENGMLVALDKNELFLLYQPQADLVTGEITGFEALLRWRHPQLGLVLPDRFIRIAENNGLIMPIGEWVLSTACQQAREWQDDGLLQVPVAVNASAVQFRQPGFRHLIGRVLRETGLPPQYLELEITEGILLSNTEATLQVLQELRATGLKLAIDDFGTGYCSLSYLKQFPVSKLKIDRSFIRDLVANPGDAAITSAIINMAKSMNLRVIAEGVENDAQVRFLRAQRCDEIQGYYLAKPLSPEEAAELLRATTTRARSPCLQAR
jgi:diguanylate cyclase (GGDEF)-like protein/PAS domain S-box-containing protein